MLGLFLCERGSDVQASASGPGAHTVKVLNVPCPEVEGAKSIV